VCALEIKAGYIAISNFHFISCIISEMLNKEVLSTNILFCPSKTRTHALVQYIFSVMVYQCSVLFIVVP
jgi:hypothetical protein